MTVIAIVRCRVRGNGAPGRKFYRMHIGARACLRKPGSDTGNCDRTAWPNCFPVFPMGLFILYFIYILDIEYFEYLYISPAGRSVPGVFSGFSDSPGDPAAVPGNPVQIR